MQFMSAKEYAERTNYPLETIRKMCRDGELLCDKRGKVYLIEVGAADRVIENRMLARQAEKSGARQAVRRSKQMRISGTRRGVDFLEALKVL